MKREIYLILFFVLLASTIFAQPPQKFKYQGVVRNISGSPIANRSISLRISLLEGSSTGASVYVESHHTTTNQFGLFNIDVGGGTPVSGSFLTISWNNEIYFQKVEIDTLDNDNYVLMGTTQILSVPYALDAEFSKYSYYNGYSNILVWDDENTTFNFYVPREQNVMVEVWGGGGGGGSVSGSYRGGGSGGYAKGVFHLMPGVPYLIDVGIGGDYNGLGTGFNGQTSSFGSLISATGGQGGNPSDPVTNGGIGLGQLNIHGGNATGIDGGDCPNGGMGGIANSPAGIQPGGGGCGSGVGNGGNGRIVIYY